MNISRSLAQRIVEEIGSIINQHINFIDTDCVIVASTDKERINMLHEGSKMVLETKEPLVINSDNEYRGAKQGVNLPAFFNQDIIGVIGVTGKPSEVERYGQIIKKITEILCVEDYYISQRRQLKKAREQIVREFISMVDTSEEAIIALKTRAELLDMYLDKVKLVILVYLRANDEQDELVIERTKEKVYKEIRNKVKGHKNVVIVDSGMKLICMYEDADIKYLKTQIIRITKEIEQRFNVNLFFGIGTQVNSIYEIRESYKKADEALRIAIQSQSENNICIYDELGIELLISDISEEVKRKFTSMVFKGKDETYINETIKLLKVYFSCDGSITKAADKLFIHKNTLQYRLNKMKNELGLDPRIYNEAFTLQTAIRIYEFIT